MFKKKVDKFQNSKTKLSDRKRKSSSKKNKHFSGTIQKLSLRKKKKD